MRRAAAILFLSVVAAVAQPEVPAGIRASQLPDHVWRFDRQATPQPIFWERLLSEFGVRPAKTRPFGRSVAFLVGVAQYSNLRPQLTFVDSDLTALRNFLLTAGGFDTVFEMRNGTVRRTLIEDYMVNKFSSESADYLTHDDRLLFYYSGHGGDKQGRVGYLQFSNATAGNFAGDDVLPLTQFQEWARLNVARHLAIILDACASGLAISAKGDASPEELLNALSGQGSGYLLTAGSGDQKAWQVEYSYNKGYSVFTHALMEALDKGTRSDDTGLMTINEVFGYIEKNIGQFEVSQGKRMVPQIWSLDRGDGPPKGTFVFLNPAVKTPRIPVSYAGVLAAKSKGEEAVDVTAGVGIIEVSSADAGRVFIDGELMGPIKTRETQQFQRQATGHHQVRFEGPKNDVEEVTVENGMIARVAFGAKSPIDSSGKQTVGTLEIASVQGSSGDAFIDDFRVGFLPPNGRLEVANVIIGAHRCRVNDPRVLSSTDCEAKANQTTVVPIAPAPPTNLQVTVK